MKRLSQTFKLSLAAFLGVFSSGLVQLYAAPNAAAAVQKIIVCHATGSATNPFEAIQPNKSSNHIDLATGVGTDEHPEDFLILTEIDTNLNWGSIQKDLDDECAAENPSTPLTAPAVTFADPCETENDKYTIPTSSEYIAYYVNGSDVATAAGTYPASETVSIEARAIHNRTLTGTTEWSHIFSNTPCAKETYYLETSHQAICGQITISLRNVSPWYYQVLIQEKNDNGEWVRVGATTGDTKWQAVPGVMIVNNKGSAPDDQTGSYIVQFAEDSGDGMREVRYKVSSGAEQDLYVGLPVGEFTTVTVNTDCIKPPVAEPSVAEWLQTPCAADTNTTDLLQVRVTNKTDATAETVTYTITATPVIGAAIQKVVAVDDGENKTVAFANLPAGTYTLSIKATDGTDFKPKTITISQCTVVPGSGGGQILGNGVTITKNPSVLPTTALPTSLPATGADGTQNQLVIVLAALTAYGATFFFQNRRKLSANEA